MGKSRDYAVMVSIFSATVALTCVGIVVFHNFDQNGVVELGTFLGIGVALIGICATLIVGLQILNYIEFKEVKDKLNNIDAIKKNLEEKELKIERLRLHSAVWNANNLALQATKELDPQWRMSLLIMSIAMQAEHTKSDHISGILSRYDGIIGCIKVIKVIDTKKLYNWDEFKFATYPKGVEGFEELTSRHMEAVYKIESLIKNTQSNNE